MKAKDITKLARTGKTNNRGFTLDEARKGVVRPATAYMTAGAGIGAASGAGIGAGVGALIRKALGKKFKTKKLILPGALGLMPAGLLGAAIGLSEGGAKGIKKLRKAYPKHPALSGVSDLEFLRMLDGPRTKSKHTLK